MLQHDLTLELVKGDPGQGGVQLPRGPDWASAQKKELDLGWGGGLSVDLIGKGLGN